MIRPFIIKVNVSNYFTFYEIDLGEEVTVYTLL